MAGRGTDIKIGSRARELGGLHVIATQPQASARIDRQLFGRAARQGDPGSCRMFVSADDQIIVQHAPALKKRMQRLAGDQGNIETDLSADVGRLQARIQRLQYAQRRSMFNHDDWLESALGKLASRQ
jgi:preprotein translocase subunit SecA